MSRRGSKVDEAGGLDSVATVSDDFMEEIDPEADGAPRLIRKRFRCGHKCGAVIGHMVWKPTYEDGFHFEPNERYSGVERLRMICIACAKKVAAVAPVSVSR